PESFSQAYAKSNPASTSRRRAGPRPRLRQSCGPWEPKRPSASSLIVAVPVANGADEQRVAERPETVGGQTPRRVESTPGLAAELGARWRCGAWSGGRLRNPLRISFGQVGVVWASAHSSHAFGYRVAHQQATGMSHVAMLWAGSWWRKDHAHRNAARWG